MPAKAPARETKTLSFQIKATGTSVNSKGQPVGKIEAYGAIYNNVDEGNDRILPGAFVRTARNGKARAEKRENDYILPMLWNHDDKHFFPLGGWYDIDPSDPKGLHCKGDVLLTTQAGHDYYELAVAGMTDLFSIIYDVPAGGAKYDKSGVRELSELRLFSIDPVVFAMNDETYLVGVKSNKGKPMDEKEPPQRKTLLDHYNDALARDLLEDWKEMFLDSLTCAVFDAFTIGDQPLEDIKQALTAFNELVTTKFVPLALECNLSQYLADNGYSYTPGLNLMQDGPDDGPYYGYMSRRAGLSQKAGRSISSANQGNIDDHVAGLHDMADKCMKSLKTAMQQVKAVHAHADNFAATMQGDKQDEEEPEDGQKSLLSVDEVERALGQLKLLRK